MKLQKLEWENFAAVLMVVVLITVFTAFSAFAVTPEDIEGHWAQERIQKWLDRDMALGYPEGIFQPDKEVSRAEFVTFLNRAFHLSGTQEPVNFDDVHEEDWYHDHVAGALAEGVLSGYPDNTFRPESFISREEVSVVIHRMLGLDEKELGEVFADREDISYWAREAVASIVEAELMMGYPDGTFNPKAPITRAEAISALDRAMKLDPIVRFNFAPGELIMEIGDQGYIQVYVTNPPADAAIEYESDDESVATVDDEGLVTAEAEGETKIKITVYAEGYEPAEDRISITVVPE